MFKSYLEKKSCVEKLLKNEFFNTTLKSYGNSFNSISSESVTYTTTEERIGA